MLLKRQEEKGKRGTSEIERFFVNLGRLFLKVPNMGIDRSLKIIFVVTPSPFGGSRN